MSRFTSPGVTGLLIDHRRSLRLRYNLPIQMPSNAASSLFLPVSNALPHSSSPSTTAATPRTSPDPDTKAFPPNSKRGRENAPRIDFDPLIVAKRAEGWEGMLVEVLGKWVEAAAREARGESPVGPKSF